jgi:hypothetical protein
MFRPFGLNKLKKCHLKEGIYCKKSIKAEEIRLMLTTLYGMIMMIWVKEDQKQQFRFAINFQRNTFLNRVSRENTQNHIPFQLL